MLVPVLALAGFALAAAAGWAVFATVTLYTAITLAYSFHVKRVPILDVAVLATLFTLRLFLGVVAIGAVISPWLFVFSMALFLSLSTAKRHTEVVRMALHGKTKTAGRGYIARDEPMLLALGLAAAMSAVVLFSLYLTAEAFHAAMYTAPGFCGQRRSCSFSGSGASGWCPSAASWTTILSLLPSTTRQASPLA